MPHRRRRIVGYLLLSALAPLSLLSQAVADPPATTPTKPNTEELPVTIHVHANESEGELRPIWRYYGADEPNYATMPHGEKLLAELGKIGPEPAYFRAHNLLTTGDGTPALKWGSTNAYTEDAQGNPIYDWTIVDGILEAGLKRGVKPYLQLGFMPQALSIKPEPYRHHWTPAAKYDEIYTGWAYPPKDYAKWEELIYQLTRHCVDKYGHKEALSWYWEVWNEPNIGYWRGTPEEYYQLYDHAVAGVRRALPEARVGGPENAGGAGGTYLQNFLEHCARGTNYATGKIGSPLDFIAFHAKGQPRFVDGHVRMGIANELDDIDSAFRVVASFPEYKQTPIVIGECDPDGCAACQGLQLGYRNGTLYSSYTAASFARIYDLAAKHGVHLDGALTWAFTFENQAYFAGFRQLATNGIALPVLNTFRMFGKMSGERVRVEGSDDLGLEALLKSGVRDAPDVAAFAARDKKKLCVLLWDYHDDDVPGPSADVDLEIDGLPILSGHATLSHFRIDETHSNAFTAWKEIGSPQQPTPDQYTTLEHASDLALLEPPSTVAVANGTIHTRLTLPRQAVSLLVFGW